MAAHGRGISCVGLLQNITFVLKMLLSADSIPICWWVSSNLLLVSCSGCWLVIDAPVVSRVQLQIRFRGAKGIPACKASSPGT